MNKEYTDTLNKIVNDKNIPNDKMKLAEIQTNASQSIFGLCSQAKRLNKKFGDNVFITTISGLTLTYSDNPDEALNIINKIKEVMIKQIKEVESNM